MQTGHRPVNGGSMDGTAGPPPLVEVRESLMFDHLCRSAHPTVDADRLKSQAADVGALLSDASVRAGQAAETFAHQAKDAAVQAKDWAAPRVEKAWYEGMKAAAPKVELAAEKALPLVDRTHDRLVDDVLPKLLAAVNAAAAAAAVGADKARDVASARLTDLAHIAPEPPKKSHTGAKVFWSIAGLAIAGAVLAAFRRSRPTTDPWAEEPWEDAEEDLDARTTQLGDDLGDAADLVSKKAADVTAAVKDSSAKVAELARETATKAADVTAAAPASKPATPRRSNASRTAGVPTTPGTTGAGTAPKRAPRRSAAAKPEKPGKDAPTD